MTGHPADGAPVSGRMEPLEPTLDKPPVTHVVRLAGDLEFRGHATHGVMRMTCTGCPGYRRTLEASYALEDLVRLATMHEQGA